jgi:uncharacterized protein
MGKFVFWIGVIALIWLGIRLVKILQRKHEVSARQDEPAGTRAGETGQAPPPAVQMMQCAHCGVYLPGHEAVHDRQDVFCSIEHRKAGPSAPPGPAP